METVGLSLISDTETPFYVCLSLKLSRQTADAVTSYFPLNTSKVATLGETSLLPKIRL